MEVSNMCTCKRIPKPCPDGRSGCAVLHFTKILCHLHRPWADTAPPVEELQGLPALLAEAEALCIDGGRKTINQIRSEIEEAKRYGK